MLMEVRGFQKRTMLFDIEGDIIMGSRLFSHLMIHIVQLATFILSFFDKLGICGKVVRSSSKICTSSISLLSCPALGNSPAR